MKIENKHIGFWISIALFLIIIPYSVIEWFDKAIPFSPSLYILSGASIVLLAINIYYLMRKN